MKIKLENIGLLLEAEIELNSISVVAAENDSGKSTIGKSLFSTINTLNTFKEEFKSSFNRKISEMSFLYQDLFSEIDNYKWRLELDNSISKQELEDVNSLLDFELNNLTFPKEKILNYLDDYLFDSNIESLDRLKATAKEFEIETFSTFKKAYNIFNDKLGKQKKKKYSLKSNIDFSFNNFNNDPHLKARLDFSFNKITTRFKDLLNDLNTVFDKSLDYNEIKKLSFERNFNYEFLSGIKNCFVDDKESRIEVISDNLNIEVIFNNNKVEEVSIPTITSRQNSVNVLYLESPIIIDYLENLCDVSNAKTNHPIRSSSSLNYLTKNYKLEVLKKALGRESQSDIIDDLLKKDLYDELINNIHKIISGTVEYDRTNKKYIYKKNDAIINIKNTASGIKTFGIIEILLRNRSITENTILIIDEPEVHLHPNWQVKYAEVLAYLAKKLKTKILINSHSPYFTEAMEIMGSYYDLKDMKFYGGIKKDKETVFKDYTTEVSNIYNSLSDSAFDLLDNYRSKVYFDILGEENVD